MEKMEQVTAISSCGGRCSRRFVDVFSISRIFRANQGDNLKNKLEEFKLVWNRNSRLTFYFHIDFSPFALLQLRGIKKIKYNLYNWNRHFWKSRTNFVGGGSSSSKFDVYLSILDHLRHRVSTPIPIMKEKEEKKNVDKHPFSIDRRHILLARTSKALPMKAGMLMKPLRLPPYSPELEELGSL